MSDLSRKRACAPMADVLLRATAQCLCHASSLSRHHCLHTFVHLKPRDRRTALDRFTCRTHRQTCGAASQQSWHLIRLCTDIHHLGTRAMRMALHDVGVHKHRKHSSTQYCEGAYTDTTRSWLPVATHCITAH